MFRSYDRAAHHRMLHVNIEVYSLRSTYGVGVGVHQRGVEDISASPGSAGGHHCNSLYTFATLPGCL